MTDLLAEFGRAVFSEAGVVALVLIATNAVTLWLYMSERAYSHRTAEDLRKVAVQTAETLTKLSTVVELMRHDR